MTVCISIGRAAPWLSPLWPIDQNTFHLLWPSNFLYSTRLTFYGCLETILCVGILHNLFRMRQWKLLLQADSTYRLMHSHPAAPVALCDIHIPMT